jgi:hypothetical protein
MRKLHKEHETQMAEAKQVLQSDIETASAFILQLQEELLNSRRTSLDLLTHLKRFEVQN